MPEFVAKLKRVGNSDMILLPSYIKKAYGIDRNQEVRVNVNPIKNESVREVVVCRICNFKNPAENKRCANCFNEINSEIMIVPHEYSVMTPTFLSS